MKTAAAEATSVIETCGLRQRIIQVHPSLRCNLLCTHCYSESGPAAQAFLDPATLCLALEDAASMGYEVVSFSGGEPLLYWGLDRALGHAKFYGLRTTVTTNGTLLSEKRLNRLKDRLDLLAISLDGPPALHNRIRNSPHAFSKLLAGLDSVRKMGIPFGFIHTLTQKSWEHLLWLADFAAEQGAALLQVHPLERAGRSERLLQQDWPQEDTFARASLLTVVLAANQGRRLTVQLDIFPREDLLAHPELVYASEFDPISSREQPADLLSPIIVEADGSVVPVCYGFSRDYALGNLKEERLVETWPRYVRQRYPAFRRFCREVFTEIAAQRDAPFVNWHELIVTRSHYRVHRME